MAVLFLPASTAIHCSSHIADARQYQLLSLRKEFMIAHCLGGDMGVRVELLQHFVDVDGIRLLSLPLLLLAVSSGSLGFAGLLAFR